MGGMGTWQMLLDYNVLTGTKGHIFAAGMPLAGTNRKADPAAAAKALRQVPIWAIHGALDKEVSLDWDRDDGKTVVRQPDIPLHRRFRTRRTMSGTPITRPEVWDWLFAQRSEGTEHVSVWLMIL